MDDDWYPDPTGRFTERYVLRGEWSALVRRGDVEGIDALTGCPPTEPAGFPVPEAAARIRTMPSTPEPTSAPAVSGPELAPSLRARAENERATPAASAGDAPTRRHRRITVLPDVGLPSLLVFLMVSSAVSAGTQAVLSGESIVEGVPQPAFACGVLVAGVALLAWTNWQRRRFRAANRVVGRPERVVVLALTYLYGLGMVVGLGAQSVLIYRTQSLARSEPSGWASEWDPRIEGIAQFVERERSLEFVSPVRVEFLAENEFLAYLGVGTASGSGSLDPQWEVLYRSVGLIEADADLDDASDSLATAVVGLYSYEDKAIRVRGTELTPAVRVTLAHELTHALQDQHFDLTALTEAAAVSGAHSAATAVIEGDAVLVENAFRETLSGAERAAVDVDHGEVAEQSSGAPRLLDLAQSYPYIFGEWFIGSVMTISGAGQRNELYGRMPRTELQILDPHLYISGYEPVEVREPTLAPGEQAASVQLEGMGMLGWYLVLGERLGAGPAWEATRGWRGEADVTVLTEDGRLCERISVAFENQARAQVFAFALATAVQAESMAAASAIQLDIVLCGDDVWQPMGPDDTDDLVLVPIVNYEVQQQLLADGHPAELATCVADRLIGRPEALDAIQRDDTGTYEAILNDIVPQCR